MAYKTFVNRQVIMMSCIANLFSIGLLDVAYITTINAREASLNALDSGDALSLAVGATPRRS